jgi:hypothetical protein
MREGDSSERRVRCADRSAHETTHAVQRRSSRSWIFLALLLAGSLSVHNPAQEPRLEIVRLDGQTEIGTLVGLTPEIKIAVTEGVISVPWSEILSLRPADTNPTTRPADAPPLEATLADGSVLAGEITAGGQDRFALRLSGGQECRLGLSDVRSIRVLAAPALAQEKMAELLPTAATATSGGADAADENATDVAVVARGAEVVVLRGRILELGPQRVQVDWNGREVALPWARLGGLIFAHPAARRAPCIVRLTTGNAIAGQVVGGAAGVLKLRCTAFENDVDLPWSSVERIDCHSERLVILTDLKPTRYEFEPFFDKAWDYATDATLTGQPIQLGGRTFARGLSMHSRSKLVYALDGQFERFTATAGILDEMGPRGCVTLRVRGDGRVLWSAEGVRGGEPPREVSVEIAGVRELALEVDYDADLDLSDQAAWGFARLIR